MKTLQYLLVISFNSLKPIKNLFEGYVGEQQNYQQGIKLAHRRFSQDTPCSQPCNKIPKPITHLINNVIIKGRTNSKSVNVVFLCLNPKCVSVKNHRAV